MVNRHIKSFMLTLLLVTLVMSFLSSVPAALAEYNPDANIIVERGAYHPELKDVKSNLYKNGYYDQKFDRAVLEDFTLDDWTMNAIARFARENPDEPCYDGHGEGLTQKAMWDLLHNPIKSLEITYDAPVSPDYRPISDRDEDAGDEIARIQEQLIRLNYLKAQDSGYSARKLTPAVFDALRMFLEKNGRSDLFDAHVIGSDAQEVLFDENALPNTMGAIEKLRDYFLTKTVLFGLMVPTLVIWILGLLLLIACVIAIIYFFGSSEVAKDQRPDGQKSTPKPKKGKKLKFEITYQNDHKSCERVLDGTLEIGRNTDGLPLNPEDSEISRKHCELYFKQKSLMLRDISSYGTSVNGELVHNAEHLLKSGDVFVIGSHAIRVTW